MINNVLEKIKTKFDRLEQTIDQKLLLSNPELWRRGYARIFRFCLQAIIIYFPILCLLILGMIWGEGNMVGLVFLLLLLSPFASMLGLFHLHFGGDKDIHHRSFKETERTHYSYHPKKERQILWINLGLVILGHIYPIIAFLIVVWGFSIFSPNNGNKEAATLSPSEEYHTPASDLRNIALYEYHYLTKYEQLSEDMALRVLEDSLLSSLLPELTNQLDSDFIHIVINDYQVSDSNLVSLDYQISLYLDIDAEELSDFSSQRRNYSELATILNRKYAPQDDSFFSNLFKVFLAWYVFVIGKWLLKKAYFRDVQARRLRRKEKKIWIILKKIMKWAWKVILAFCFIFVIICIYLILDYNGEDYTDSTNFWLVEWIRFVLHALPALLAKAVKIGEIAIPIVLLFFMYRYFWVFPRQKRKIYTESFTPENTERDREFKRASSTPMDRFIEKVQNKKKSKYFYRIEELLLLHLPELWRRDILNGLRLAVKIFFYFLLASVFFTGMVTILRNNGIISPKFMYQALAVPNICTFFFPLIIWLIFVPLKKNIGQVVQQARYTFFNFSRERILFVFLLFVGGFFLSCFHVNRYAIYTIGTVATKSMEGFDDFYTRILQTSALSRVKSWVKLF